MKHKSLKILSALALTLFLNSTANASLFSRLGGQAIYDDVLDVTWLADANFAVSNQFGLALSSSAFENTPNTVGSIGVMNAQSVTAWIAGMNTANYLGSNNWRLPSLSPINGSTYNSTFSSAGISDVGQNVSAPGTIYAGSTASEAAHLFFNTLGNIAYYDTSGNQTGCNIGSGAGACLSNTGLFANLRNGNYWTELDTGTLGNFGFHNGYQSMTGGYKYSLAVLDGDVSAVPVPAAVWLFGSALMGLVGVRRKKA